MLSVKLTSATTRDILIAPQMEVCPAKDGRPAPPRGIGLGVGSFNGHRSTEHNGGILRLNVETMTFPDDQTTVIVITNRDPPVATMMLRDVLPMLFDRNACTADPAM